MLRSTQTRLTVAFETNNSVFMLMNIKTTLQAFVLSLFVSSANAAVITATNFTDFPSTNYISNDSGVALNNTFVAVGFFSTLTDTDLQNLTPTSFSQIISGSAFTQFAGSIGWLGAGVYQGDATAAINIGSQFIGKSIYTLIGNAATLGTSTELLIAKHSSSFAADAPTYSANAYLDVSTASGTVLWGSVNKFTTDLSGFGGSVTAPNFSTLAAVVPEPSRAMLAAMGLFAGLVRRRRK